MNGPCQRSARSRVEGSSDMLGEVHGTGRHVSPACKLGQCVSPAALFDYDEDTVDPVSPRTTLAALVLPSPSLNTEGEGVNVVVPELHQLYLLGLGVRQRNSRRKRSLKPSLARTAIRAHLVALSPPPPPTHRHLWPCGPHSQLVIACKCGEAGLSRSMMCYTSISPPSSSEPSVFYR
ncbi:hypothetical protein BD626DRAFT_499505 [Schizophyllum amplum]|uniref:Uncharacterized protein n=1 Tax=Schizophyllum amplum TaxID=97359 RepID=A0A550CB76_9AGAR|nr:hypothetical protein BD626DRAFT_499505 [Auriculariopsis ampla]